MRLCLVLVFGFGFAVSMAGDGVQKSKALAVPYVTQDQIVLQPLSDYAQFTLTVRSQDGVLFRKVFSGLHNPFIETMDPEGHLLADGSYVFELRAHPILLPETKEALVLARKTGDRTILENLPQRTPVLTGHFRIHHGAFVVPANSEENGARPGGEGEEKEHPMLRTQYIPDDLSVAGNACIGSQCANAVVNGETLHLETYNTRILFNDTSVAPYPSRDWRIAANDDSPNGAEYLAVEDLGQSSMPFVVGAGNPSNTLYLSNGNLGAGTNSPVQDVHVVTGDSPTLRLEQDGSQGFAPGRWDVGANETWFFINSVDMSANPFRIYRNAPDQSLVVDHSGEVQVKTDLSVGADITAGGNISASCGTLTCASDRNLKENFTHVDGLDILEKVADLPITSWNYIHESDQLRHIGPMAQDFHAAFGVGRDNLSISVTDASGVALGAVQGLYSQLLEKEERVLALEEQLREQSNLMTRQEARLRALEKALMGLNSENH